MNCKNCHSKLPSFSAYCENCGVKGPSFDIRIRFYWKSLVALLKKHIWLTVMVACMLVVTVGLSIFLNVSNKIDLTDYIVTEVNGYNENGSIKVSINYDALGEKLFGKKPTPDTAKGYEEYAEYIAKLEKFNSILFVSSDKSTGLKNGDFYLATVTVSDSSLFKEYGFKIKEDSCRKVFQIGKNTAFLDAPVEINIFDYLDVSFSGTNGYGSLNISNEVKTETISFASGKQTEITIQYEEYWYNSALIIRFKDTNAMVSLALNGINSSYLSNGDSVELSLDEDQLKELGEYGLSAKTKSHIYQVSGLIE